MDTDTTTNANFIDGKLVPGSSEEVSEVTNPATGLPIAYVPESTADDVDAAVAAAERAFAGDWRDATPSERADLLFEMADMLEENKEELGELESQNVGKPRPAAIDEVLFSAATLRFMAGAARIPDGQAAAEYVRGVTSMIRREPIGVCAQITPWNYPLIGAAWKIGPALATGNTIVLKPSELTPLTAIRMATHTANILPPGVLNIVNGRGPTVGAHLAGHPRVRLISLTGSTDSGRKVAIAAAQNLKRVHLELGGKAPVIVFDDADISAVAQTLRVASYWNSGQDCTSACRVIAGAGVYDDLMTQLIEQAESLKVGDPADSDDIEMGPVVSERQRERVMGFVDRAVDAGSSVATGAKTVERPGFFVAPTILTNPDQRSEIVQQEVFGPVVTVQRFSDAAEAIAWANDSEYGLVASVWTASAQRGLDVVRQLQYGCVWLNDHYSGALEMPHGGFKQSGYGKELSKYGVEEYTQIKHVLARFA